LRVPDDGRTYPLPPGLGNFPLRHVDDFADAVPPTWMRHGGVMLPMYQSEALWISFQSNPIQGRGRYPFAVKIATGKINAVNGAAWSNELHSRKQDYLVAPNQPWLDGYCVTRGLIRQFVAMPLGDGYTAEEQLTGEAEHGGLQIIVYPMKRDAFERHFPMYNRRRRGGVKRRARLSADALDMGLAPGGKIKQEIYKDPYGLRAWDRDTSSRTFVHLANSLMWRSITGQKPPRTTATAHAYTKAGLPWFDYYDDRAQAVRGSLQLNQLKSVHTMGKLNGTNPLPENTSTTPGYVVQLRDGLGRHEVRDGDF